MEDERVLYGVAVVPQPFCGAIGREFVKDSFCQKASCSYLGLHVTVEKAASWKEKRGGNILAVSCRGAEEELVFSIRNAVSNHHGLALKINCVEV